MPIGSGAQTAAENSRIEAQTAVMSHTPPTFVGSHGSDHRSGGDRRPPAPRNISNSRCTTFDIQMAGLPLADRRPAPRTSLEISAQRKQPVQAMSVVRAQAFAEIAKFVEKKLAENGLDSKVI